MALWLCRAIAVAVLLPLLAGCGLLSQLRSLNRSIERAARQTAIEGRVAVKGGGGPIVVVAYDEDAGEVADLFVMPQARPYFFALPPGRYRMAAFIDLNRDLEYQTDEPATIGDAVDAVAGERSDGLDLHIDPKLPQPLPFAVDSHATNSGRIRQFPAPQTGTVVDMDDWRFSEENARLGLWDPLRFLFDVGAGVYFLEKYDPKKIPILFVHGALGHPGNWSYLVGRIDRDRFQPWLVYYPTAPRLERISQMLLRALSTLQARYQFPRIVLVSHSMGGLVARGAVNMAVADMTEDRIVHMPLFVSISTPWNGHAAAARGVERSPVVAPYWRDIAPNSPFLEALPQTPLPPETTYTLFFGFGGRGGAANDGSIPLSSQLSMPIQTQAHQVVGFDELHMGILNSAALAEKLNQALAAIPESE